jgi:hypothetical protein
MRDSLVKTRDQVIWRIVLGKTLCESLVPPTYGYLPFEVSMRLLYYRYLILDTPDLSIS